MPPGFTITTEACNDYFAAGEQLPGRPVGRRPRGGPARSSGETGKGFGDPANPLLVSVRSGAKFSMPGMMDTVLNLGLNEQTLQGLIALTGNERFGWDAYRRFIQMFGRIVMERQRRALRPRARCKPRRAHGAEQDTDLDAAALRELVGRVQGDRQGRHRARLPGRPATSSSTWRSRRSSRSWFGKRARDYRENQKIADDLGTAVNVVTMVFGNMGDDSGTGVAFTRDPNTGEKVLFGEYLTNAQGEDVVAGIRTRAEDRPDADRDARGLRRVRAHRPAARAHYRDVQDLEFTIERGRLYMLQTRSAKRTRGRGRAHRRGHGRGGHHHQGGGDRPHRAGPRRPAAARPVRPGRRCKAATRIAKGLNASPGAAVGRAVFDADAAVEWVEQGEKVVLVRIETSPDDFHGMAVAQGILTARGGATSTPRSSRARSASRASPAAPSSSSTTPRSPPAAPRPASRFTEGDWISLDGTTGEVFLGALPTVSARFEDQPELQQVLGWADEIRRMGVWTNADKPEEAAQARGYGAQGIGLCRTEHMFREGERLEIVRGAILVASQATRAKAKLAARRDARRGRARGRRARSTPRWPSWRCSSRATSRASSRPWTACRSSSG